MCIRKSIRPSKHKLQTTQNKILYNHTHFIYNVSMIVNNELSQIDRIRKIMKDQNGTLLTSDLAEHKIPRTYLSILEHNGEIERVSRGVYRAVASIEDELYSFQATHKVSIYSHETALYIHDLADRTPLAYSITVPIGYHSASLNKSNHKVFYINRALLDLGVIMMKSPHGNPIRVTGLERVICDILRNRNQIDIQMIYEALKRYVGKKDRDINLLYTYARRFTIQKIAREYIEVLL
jgi:predicted transcriptional regulator of viral defense system